MTQANATRHPPRRRRPNNLARLNNSPTIGRFAIVNHFNRTVDLLAETSRFPRLAAFLPQNLWPWLWNYLKNAFTSRYPFPDYAGSGRTGSYTIRPRPGRDSITISIAGDWGTGTQEAQTVADLMAQTDPDFTIHLGDVYYVGDAPELDENCFGKSRQGFAGTTWPHGAQGSFALNANHEMYANGKPYFTTFLRSLGSPPGLPGQIASFFCLEADQWRIIGLDTGYNSVGIPILSMIPGINALQAIGGSCDLPKPLLEWLRNTVRPKEQPKPTVLLSHHQYFTAFSDHAYTRPARQLIEFFDTQEVLWLWGHEHRLAIYAKFSAAGGITAYGRCVGHGGMPVDLGAPDKKKAPLEWYDTRSHALDDGTPVGQNGFVNLTIHGPTLALDYRDINNTQVVAEEFSAGPNGTLQCARSR